MALVQPLGGADVPSGALAHPLARRFGLAREIAIAELRILPVGVEQGTGPERLSELGIRYRGLEPPAVELASDLELSTRHATATRTPSAANSLTSGYHLSPAHSARC